MRLELDTCVVRSWRLDDAESVARHANNRAVWIHLRDGFPHPYGREDAAAFLATVLQQTPERTFAIEVDGEASGSIGITPGTDVERIGAEVGYWLGEPFWGRGVVSEALHAVTRHVVETHGLRRVWAVPFATNVASARVLEKAGYVREARMRQSAIKDGQVLDQYLYAYVV